MATTAFTLAYRTHRLVFPNETTTNVALSSESADEISATTIR